MMLTLAPLPALAADDSACDSVEEVLEWTADLLMTVRDGKSDAYDNGGMYVADAAEYALERVKEAAWSDAAIAATTGLHEKAAAFRRDPAAPEAASELLALADALAVEAADICGAGIVPALVRPGVGDPRACDQVIEALDAAKRVLPTVAGESGAPPPMFLLSAAVEAEKAAGHAAASQWNAEAIAALNALGAEARALQSDHTRFSADTAAAFAGLVAPAVSEALEICREIDVPSFP